MYFYKENIELYKLKAENSKFEFHAVNRWYEDIKNHGINNKKQITIDTVSQLTGLTTKQIFRAILHESNLHSRRR